MLLNRYSQICYSKNNPGNYSCYSRRRTENNSTNRRQCNANAHKDFFYDTESILEHIHEACDRQNSATNN